VKSVKVSPDTFELQFQKTSVDDNGNWAVIARNPHGEMSQFFTFAAQMLPKFETRCQFHTHFIINILRAAFYMKAFFATFLYL
jgi:hypothetical protein